MPQAKSHSTRFSVFRTAYPHPDLIFAAEVHILRTSLALLLVNFSFAVTLLVPFVARAATRPSKGAALN